MENKIIWRKYIDIIILKIIIMSLQQTLRIGIVGMGTGGLASAIFIQRLGHHVTIFE